MLTLKDLEHLLKPYPPLTGRWTVYACRACGEEYGIDVRVERMPVLPSLVSNRCPYCSSTDVHATGMQIHD